MYVQVCINERMNVCVSVHVIGCRNVCVSIYANECRNACVTMYVIECRVIECGNVCVSSLMYV